MGQSVSIMTIMQDEEEPIRWYLESCAHLAQNFPDLKEVVLVDGGSKDNTLAVVEEYKDRVPLRVFERPWDFTRAQMNYGLDQCTGDYIFVPDADMTWTTNFADWLKTGVFVISNYWDMMLLFTVKDAYHFFKWPIGPSMRLFKGGLRYDETRKYHVHLQGQHSGIPVVSEVVLFENSCRISSDAALLERGARRQYCVADMESEGGGPGPVDRFVQATRSPEAAIARVDPDLERLVLPSTNTAVVTR